MEKYTM